MVLFEISLNHGDLALEFASALLSQLDLALEIQEDLVESCRLDLALAKITLKLFDIFHKDLVAV